MAVQVFNLSEILTRHRNSMSLTDGEPFRIRIQFGADVKRAQREETIATLRSIGYRQVGNTSIWVLNLKLLETD